MSLIRLSSVATPARFVALQALYPSASVAYTLLSDDASLCIVRAAVSRWPGDPAPAVAHAGSALSHVSDVDWRWTTNFSDVRDAALDRACQNLWLPSALAEGPSASERWKAQHAAFAWLWQRASRERSWEPGRVEVYRYLIAALAITDEALLARCETLLTAEAPDPVAMGRLVEYFGGRADADRAIVDLPSHLLPPRAVPTDRLVPEGRPDTVALKMAFFTCYPEATIQTTCSRLRDGTVAVQAVATLTPTSGAVGGSLEVVVRGKGPSLLNLASVESCETRAVGDVLVKLGVRAQGAWAVAVPAAEASVQALLAVAGSDPVGLRAITTRLTRGGLTDAHVSLLRAHYESGGVLDGVDGRTVEHVLRQCVPSMAPALELAKAG